MDQPYEGWKTVKHTPPHLLVDQTWYMVSAGTWNRLAWFDDAYLAERMVRTIEEECMRAEWELALYVVMPDHYHVVTRSKLGIDLPKIVKRAHGRMAAEMRKRFAALGRIGEITKIPGQFFCNYWDTCLNSEKSLLEAMEYVRSNPRTAGLASIPEQYRFLGPRD